jgi:aryl-alcohol dehydrogenase-like predicted oxidoreductase
MKYVRLGSSGLKVSHVCLGVKRNVVELAEVPTGRDGRTDLEIPDARAG